MDHETFAKTGTGASTRNTRGYWPRRPRKRKKRTPSTKANEKRKVAAAAIDTLLVCFLFGKFHCMRVRTKHPIVISINFLTLVEKTMIP